MKILICNAGSTSLKFKIYDMPSERVIISASAERIGDPAGGSFIFNGHSIKEEIRSFPDYEAGIRYFLAAVKAENVGFDALGFKTVLSKGYNGTYIINDDVINGMREYLTVAPAHNRHYIEAINTFKKLLPDMPAVGAFETAFHSTMEPEAYIYPVPYEWYEKYGIRRFGYHGASHSYVGDNLTELLGSKYKAVSCHLGGSCSLCAITDGKSVDTSFGMSLQAGLPQSNRSGDFDPFIIDYLIENEGMSKEEIFASLRKKGGLLGISGISGDYRDIENAADKDPRAKLARDIFTRELVRYISGYAGIMGGIDAIAFTGGIGENSAYVRNFVMNKLAFLGIKPLEDQPLNGIRKITDAASKVSVFVIPANEELGIARKTYKTLANKGE